MITEKTTAGISPKTATAYFKASGLSSALAKLLMADFFIRIRCDMSHIMLLTDNGFWINHRVENIDNGVNRMVRAR